MATVNYEKLLSDSSFDIERAREYAKLLEEYAYVESRLAFLKKIMRRPENKKMDEYLWRTAGGAIMPIHDMEDSHVRNAVNAIARRKGAGAVPIRLSMEFDKRFSGEKITAQQNIPLESGEGNVVEDYEDYNDDVFK
jgi:hypothetical protein